MEFSYDCCVHHGPYHCAYWRDDNGKLKKYVGRYHTPVEISYGVAKKYCRRCEVYFLHDG